MSRIYIVECPSCRSKTWEDMHSLEDDISTRFRCVRCGRVISLGKCSQCGKKNWERHMELVEKDGKKPVVRYTCRSCGRIIGLYLD